ncbi:MAG: hypothetical protein H7245_19415 [Candidatus Saccharibacteria bacterium]|nr:hypothetical protein [Pseudorhodobacter sp.]
MGTNPEVLLMDEPTGSIDTIATRRVERLIVELRDAHAIIIVINHAARLAPIVVHQGPSAAHGLAPVFAEQSCRVRRHRCLWVRNIPT